MDNFSFVPEDYLAARVHRRTNLICMTLFVIVLGGVVAAFMVTNQQRDEVIHKQMAVDGEFETAAKRLDQLEQLRRRKDEMLRKAKVTAVLVETVPRSNILAELINSMPPSVTVLELDLETKIDKTRRAKARTALEAAKDKARKAMAKKKGTLRKEDQPRAVPKVVFITLTGTAPTDVDVAKYMTELGRSQLFSNVNLQFSEQILIDEHSLRKFKVNMDLNKDMPMGAFEPKRIKRDLGSNTVPGPQSADAEPTAPTSATFLPGARAAGGQQQRD